MPRNRTKKVSNVPSEILLKIAFCQFCEPFPVVLPPVPILKNSFANFANLFPLYCLRCWKQPSATPKHHGSEGRTRHEIAPKNCLTSLLKPIFNNSLLPILRHTRHTKTPWQWRTDTPRNRTKKVSNVASEILLKIAFCQFCEPFPVVLPPVPILKIVFCQFCQPFPVVLPPVLKTALRHTKTPWQWRTDTPAGPAAAAACCRRRRCCCCWSWCCRPPGWKNTAETHRKRWV